MNTETADQITFVKAEEAPVGVPLWPTTAHQYQHNFTLDRVEVVRTETRSFVRWTYRNSKVRIFDVGEEVAVKYA